jgi:hypothetical protein
MSTTNDYDEHDGILNEVCRMLLGSKFPVVREIMIDVIIDALLLKVPPQLQRDVAQTTLDVFCDRFCEAGFSLDLD